MKRYSTVFDVAFQLEHTGKPLNVAIDVLLDALRKRVDYLKRNPSEAREAIGVCDTYEIESHEEKP